MLKVERKKKPGSRKGLLWIALAALLAAGVTLYMFFGRPEEEMPRQINTRGAIENRQESEIRRVRIRIRGQEPWTAERNADGQMEITGGPAESGGWVLDAALGERLEDALSNIVYEDILTEDPTEYSSRLAEFGLDNPALIAEVEYTDGQTHVLRIGNDSGIEDEDFRFMTVDEDPRLYAVAGNLVEDLQVERDLLHPVEQPEIQTGRLDRISVRDGNGSLLAEWRLEGEITDSDAPTEWVAVWPEDEVGMTYPADQDQIANLKKNVGNLRVGMYVAEGTPENLKDYGLDQPRRVLQIHMAAGATGRVTEEGAYDVKEWGEETLEFRIGTSRNEMTDYCLYAGQIYTVNHFTVAAIADLKPVDTAARYLAVAPAESLKSMTIQKDGETTTYELTRQTVPAEEEGDRNQTIITCRKNGREISYDAFAAAYERWRVLNVSGKLPAGWKKQPTSETYTFETVGGKSHTVEFSPFDALQDAVTLDGQTLFYLTHSSLPEMP